MKRVRLLLLGLALVYAAIELQWTRSLAWDEVEFFRATRWIAQGRLPYRDFWEHHLPLQWIVFAPAAAFLNGAGVGVLLAMRWIQLPLWVALFAIGNGILKRGGFDARQRWLALLLLLMARFFVGTALEYRVDTLGSLLFAGGVALALRERWISFGAVMSCAVLANMRLAPLIVVTALMLLWRYRLRALWMSAGVAVVAALFGGALAVTHSWRAFIDAMRFNVLTDRIVAAEAHTFWPRVLSVFQDGDIGAIALWILGLMGIVTAFRVKGLPQLLAILSTAAILLVAQLGVHYAYHFQLAFLLMAPLAARVLPERSIVALLIGAICVYNVAGRLDPSFHRTLEYQEVIMTSADRVTAPNETVWDGCGYALRRASAYEYWFLPAGVRMLAQRGLIPAYDAPQMMAAPPGAIIHNARTHYWLEGFPRAKAYATHHYIPLYRNLWIPAMSGVVPPGRRASWIVPKRGRYRVYASELLMKHPWFTRPLPYALVAGSDAPLYQVELAQVPLIHDLRVTIDGAPAGEVVTLERDHVLQVESLHSAPFAIAIVPESVKTLFIAPEEQLF